MDITINEITNIKDTVLSLQPGDKLYIAKGLYSLSYIRTLCSQINSISARRITVREQPGNNTPILIERYADVTNN